MTIYVQGVTVHCGRAESKCKFEEEKIIFYGCKLFMLLKGILKSAKRKEAKMKIMNTLYIRISWCSNLLTTHKIIQYTRILGKRLLP